MPIHNPAVSFVLFLCVWLMGILHRTGTRLWIPTTPLSIKLQTRQVEGIPCYPGARRPPPRWRRRGKDSRLRSPNTELCRRCVSCIFVKCDMWSNQMWDAIQKRLSRSRRINREVKDLGTHIRINLPRLEWRNGFCSPLLSNRNYKSVIMVDFWFFFLSFSVFG